MTRAVSSVTGIAVPLLWNNIDTDALVPAAPHKVLLGGGNDRLREILLYEFRFDVNGKPKLDFVLNDPRFAGAPILLAGENFGCGSSRESAVWALQDFGFRAVIAKSFADIFEQNAYKNHFVPAKLDAGAHADLTALLARCATSPVTLDIEQSCIKIGDDIIGRMSLDEMGRELLLSGLDEFALTARYRSDIADTLRRLSETAPWLG